MRSVLLSVIWILIAYAAQGQVAHDWSAKLSEKIAHHVSAFVGDASYELKAIPLAVLDSISSADALATTIDAVYVDQQLQGYLYVGETPSLKNVFDYMILFDKNWTIVQVKVLIYREEHGRQIGSVRWLRQFDGLGPADRPVLGDDVDGISGATISANSMTLAVQRALVLIQDHLHDGQLH